MVCFCSLQQFVFCCLLLLQFNRNMASVAGKHLVLKQNLSHAAQNPSNCSASKRKPPAFPKKKAGSAAERRDRQGVSCQNYFLRRTVMALYRLFQGSQAQWDLNHLNYGQLVAMMEQLGYLRKMARREEGLRRCYWLWVNLSDGKSFTLNNLLIVLLCLEDLPYDPQLITDIVEELQKGTAKFPLSAHPQAVPSFIFLVRKEGFAMDGGVLRLGKAAIQKIQGELGQLRLNRLMRGAIHDLEREELPASFAISKLSSHLAQNRRLEMTRRIRQQQPHLQEITLQHLLSYRDCNSEGRRQQQKEKEEKAQSRSYLLVQESHKVREVSVVIPPKESSPIQQDSFELWQSEELFDGQQAGPPSQIVDDLEWDEIPRPPEELSLQRELQERPEGEGQGEQQRKRKEYLDLPILFVDVNIEEGRKERIVVYEGDLANELAVEFGRKHGLTREMVERLEALLDMQIGSLLTKIDEAHDEDCSELY